MIDLIQKYGINNHSACPFCAQELETVSHILCVFAWQVWLPVLSPLGWASLPPGAAGSRTGGLPPRPTYLCIPRRFQLPGTPGLLAAVEGTKLQDF